jgi:hypothetical protein
MLLVGNQHQSGDHFAPELSAVRLHERVLCLYHWQKYAAARSSG